MQAQRSPRDAQQASLSVAPLWETLADHDHALALIEPSTQRCWTYRQLADEVAAGAAALAGGKRGLVLICAGNSAGFVCAYLSALLARNAVMLEAPGRDRARLIALVQQYEPDTVLANAPIPPELTAKYRLAADVFGLSCLRRIEETPAPGLNPELALLLATSGSSGRPKLVRLSAPNITANAQQIRQGLGVAPTSRAATLLPLSYIFGLSVLHSHLAAGASLVLTSGSITDPDLWRSVHEHQVTTIAGVSMTFDLLRRLQFDNRSTPSLRQVLHSGGRLSSETLAWARQTLAPNVDVRLMYGMTEGAGRLCIPPPGLINVKPESVGRPAPGGGISFSEDGEIIYAGPNVMLGYAETRSDLARGDDLNGVLHTGDRGFADTDGDIFITGRTSRILKIFGRRHSLDDLEDNFNDLATVAAAQQGDRIVIFHSDGDAMRLQARLGDVAKALGLPLGTLRLASIQELPRTVAGKIAYDRLPLSIAEDRPRPQGWSIFD
jgi:acyl-CoA synthetase (AMP-forming)/AMP-acid ligase II